MRVGWDSVSKHVSEKEKDFVVVVNVIGSYEGIVEKRWHPFLVG